LPEGSSEKEMPRRMSMKQLVSFAWQLTCTLIVSDQKYLPGTMWWLWSIHYNLQTCHCPTFACFCDSVLKGQRFSIAKEITAKAMRALTDIEKLFLGMLSKALRTLVKCVTVKGNHSEGNVV
jgi:hypothetical protein